MAQNRAFSLGGIGSPCCCGTGVCHICVRLCVGGCVTAGLTVNVLSGMTVVFSGTTNAGGCVTLTGVSSGTYTVQVLSGSTQLYSGSRSITCPGSITISIPSPSNAECCGCCSIPNSLTLTDNNGSYVTTFDPLNLWWKFSTSVTRTGMQITSVPSCQCTTTASMSIPIIYTAQCAAPNQLAVTRFWPGVSCSGTVYYTCSDVNTSIFPPCAGAPCSTGIGGSAYTFSSSSALTSAWTACAPFAWSGTLVFSGILADPVGGTVTVTG